MYIYIYTFIYIYIHVYSPKINIKCDRKPNFTKNVTKCQPGGLVRRFAIVFHSLLLGLDTVENETVIFDSWAFLN